MKKILFISANRLTIPYPVYPIGISYLYSFLKERFTDFEFEIFDINNRTISELSELLNNFSPDYVGVSLRNIDDNNIYEKDSFIKGYQEIVNTVRTHSKAVVIIGGAGFSIYPKFLFDYLNPDFGVKGEGEQSLFELITCLETKTDFRNIDGLVYKQNEETILNPRKSFTKDLTLTFDENILPFYWKNSGMLNIQTKRGCPYKCVYCSYPLIEGSHVRTLNPDMIVETLKELYYNKKINYVFFTDSIFNIHDDFNYKLAEKIIESKIRVNWGAYFSPNRLDKKLLAKLKEAGLTHIEFGTDSLSDTQLRNYNKSFTLADVIEKSNMCNELNIFFAHFLILGGYGETEQTLNETFENSKKIENTVFFPFVGMRLYPGTQLHQIALKEGKVTEKDDLLLPYYYISDQIDVNTLKERALASGKKWIFPDDNRSEFMNILRARNRKGPLWEHLRYL